ncbi:FAD-dependent oxidoreductase [Hyalangium gracile]|uniref:FAD-dependent oxidoreductase n=1 Tax=Hyalangium gracile TaxID=394092 RepID=UPI001CCA17ED|nr:FAD-binding protein [Hyalangium gracile]
MELNYDAKRIEIVQRLAGWAKRPDADFERFQMTREQATQLLWDTSGRLVFPWDADYDALRRVAYANFEDVRPSAIGVCESLHDVRTFMRFIRRQRETNPAFRWVPRAGGHSTAGYSTVEGGLMLDVRGLDNIFVEPQRRLVHVGPGVQMRDFYRTIDDYGLFAPAAICPDVRIGGMMQGGGFGFGSRMFGMSCDAVTEVEMVLANGRQVVANAIHNADLYWAVRGGTGNQFGILTRATYKLYPLQEVGAVVMQWRLGTDAEAAQGAHALDILQRRYMGSNHDRRLGYLALIQHGANFDGPFLIVRAMYRGQRGLWQQLLAELIATPGCQVQWEDMGSYYSMNNKLMGYAQEPDILPALMTPLALAPRQEKNTRYFDKHLGVAGWRQMVDHIRGAPTVMKIGPQMVIEAAGAAINEKHRGENAYIHRRADFNTYLNTYWDSEEEKPKAFAFMNRWLEIGEPWTNQEAYQNYPKPYITHWQRRYWAEYYPVLVFVKRKYDPTSVFNFEQSIGGESALAEQSADSVDELVPGVARSLRQSIVYPDQMPTEGDQA